MKNNNSKTWTDEQLMAINAKGDSILVSAAAGSGKTAVLVERVLRRITDENDPCNIDQFLIVTFTKAAAEELINRIYDQISQKIVENPQNENLRRQKILLNFSKIGTIHSFCNDLIKEYHQELNVSSDFRIAEENELKLTKLKAIDNTLNNFYNLEDHEFLGIVELFSDEKNDLKLASAIEKIYSFVSAYPSHEKWFEEKINMFDLCNFDIFKSPWGKIIVECAEEWLDCAIELTENSIEIAKNDENIKKAYFTALECDLQKLQNIKNLTKKANWDDLIKKVSLFDFEKFKPLRNYDENIDKETIINNKKYVQKIIADLKKFLCFDEKKIYEDIDKIKKISIKIFQIVKEFIKEFEKLKLEKNILDYNDLEKYTLKLLNNSEIAQEISSNFKEIMIDEYQDVNESQNTIFKLLSKNEKNLFMVGDVKQSIYGFRQAMPKIFINLKNNYETCTKREVNKPSKIILNKNFRSSKGVIDAINQTFKKLMSNKLGDIEYNDEETLKLGLTQTEYNDKQFYINILNKSNEDDNFDYIIESKHIAKIIANFVNIDQKNKDEISPVMYKDFCILLRSPNKLANKYAQELIKLGIPAVCEVSSEFLNSTEISTVISLLKIIDNPFNDVALASILLSPLFDFSTDELLNISKNSQKDTLYEKLESHFLLNKTKKIEFFFEKLDIYTEFSRLNSLSGLLNFIYYDTCFLEIMNSYENSNLKTERLDYLYNYICENEHKVFKNLQEFVKFVENLQENKLDINFSSTLFSSVNAVKIMGIHKSKGLEFPFCILAGCGKRFNTDKDAILLHTDLGVGIKLRNNENTIQYPNIIEKLIALRISHENISEELRALYVAMTRAKKKLIILACKNKLPEKFNCEKLSNSYIIEKSSSYIDWLLLCDFDITVFNNNWDENFETPELNTINSNICYKNFKNVDFNVRITENLPYETSATNLKKRTQKMFFEKKPNFMDNSLDSQEFGIITHKFLCFCDFELAKKNLENEFDKLNKKNILTAKEIERLDKNSLKNFFDSELCQRITNSKKILKEYEFTTKISSKFLNFVSNEQIIVNGIIDCAFFENENFVIVDFKTDKTDNLNQIKAKYKDQLKTYKYALEKIINIPVNEIILYSFYLNSYIIV